MSPVVSSMCDRLLSEVGASTFRVYFDFRVGVKDCYFVTQHSVTRRSFAIALDSLSNPKTTMGEECDLWCLGRKCLPIGWVRRLSENVQT